MIFINPIKHFHAIYRIHMRTLRRVIDPHLCWPKPVWGWRLKLVSHEP